MSLLLSSKVCAKFCFKHEVYTILSRTSNGKLFSINEEEQREALKGFYERCSFITSDKIFRTRCVSVTIL